MWCIVEAPHLKKVAERYAGKPVAFLAMNMDADPKDARLMVETQPVSLSISPQDVRQALEAARKGGGPATQRYPVTLTLDGQSTTRPITHP